jgi:hypothetical protein
MGRPPARRRDKPAARRHEDPRRALPETVMLVSFWEADPYEPGPLEPALWRLGRLKERLLP